MTDDESLTAFQSGVPAARIADDYDDEPRSLAEWSGEHRLVLAILADAIAVHRLRALRARPAEAEATARLALRHHGRRGLAADISHRRRARPISGASTRWRGSQPTCSSPITDTDVSKRPSLRCGRGASGR